jgi:pilus assembly protein Flp/PilA
MHLLKKLNDRGQGLVEYALILVLVAVVVIAILLMVGPVVGSVFSNVVQHLGFIDSGVIANANAVRQNANTVQVNVSVTTPTDVTVQIGSNPPKTEAGCSGTCSITLNTTNGVVPGAGGSVTITAAEGGTVIVSYPATP